MPKSTAQQPTRSPDFMQQAMDSYGDMVVRVALSHTQSYHDAQDVAQDVFMSLLTSQAHFTSREHLRAWLIRCTINRCHELRRSWWARHVVPNTPQVDGSVDAPHADEASSAVETFQRTPESPVEAAAVAALTQHPVWQAMKGLPEDLRTTAHLYYVEELSCKQIAAAMQCSPTTVRTRLLRARRQLRQALEKTSPAPEEGSK